MMFDENSGVDHRTLIGHTGPVYGVSFSPDKYYCLSCSEDGTSNIHKIIFNGFDLTSI